MALPHFSLTSAVYFSCSVLLNASNFIGITPVAQAAIRDLQQFITDHFYTCTPEILAGLGQMYVADDRFRKNIDMAGGDGTADFVAQAIAAYCGK